MSKYNYIILGSDWDLYKFSYSDLQDCTYVKYVAGNYPPKGTLRGFLYRLHFNPAINRIINLPLKKLWNKTYFKNDFADKKPLCFIVFINWVCLNVDIISYLRRTYEGCKVILICQDLVKTKKLRFTKDELNAYAIKEQVDLSLSFDPKDCETYGFDYYPLVFSSYRGALKDMSECDVYMLAKAKDRLNDIIEIYEFLRRAGLKLDFHILGVQAKDRKYADEIHYIEGTGMSYEENLQHILHSKCILEVMQKGGTGFTQRGCEAVCLGKKLLTNNPYIDKEPFYRPEFISTFSSCNNIDLNFVKHIHDNVEVDYHYKEHMSPFGLLDFIEKRL